MKRAICPTCGTNYGVQLVWGEPSEHDTYRASRGDAVLGGENVDRSRADRHCRRCGHRWCADGSPATGTVEPSRREPLRQADEAYAPALATPSSALARDRTKVHIGWWPTLALFAAVWIVGLLLAGPLACGDGWASGSIGRRGACSHHGGVNGLPRAIALLVAIVVAAFFHRARLLRARMRYTVGQGD